MKNRLKAIILATGLTASMMFTCAYAEEASTEAAATEAVTEAAATEAAETEAKAETEAAATEAAETEAKAETEAAATEAAETEAKAETEAAATEAAETEAKAETEAAAEGAETEAAEAAAGAGKYAMYYDSMKTGVVQTLQTLSDMSEADIAEYIDQVTDPASVAMVATWDSMREELGSFVEVTSQEVTEEGSDVIITSVAKYEKIDENIPVNVTYTFDTKNQSASIKWDVDYPMSQLLGQAALNTVMGIGIVFLMLLFLSFVISQLHWIPDMLNKKEKEKAAAQAAAPVSAPAPAPAVEEEEELADDLELVAVISAAIAASENAPADGFVVRSIRKANRKKWQNA